MDNLIDQAKHITKEYTFRECVVSMETWKELTSEFGNLRAMNFHGLRIKPSYHVPDGCIYPREEFDVIH